MKSAYELAMERLNQSNPLPKLKDAQKKKLAELDSQYAAKVAEREIALGEKISQAVASGNIEEITELEQRLAQERKKLQSALEDKKERIRQGKK